MKLTFDEVLERISEDRVVRSEDVYAKDLDRGLWYAEWHIIGCLPESWAYCLTKKEAIETCLQWAAGSESGKESWEIPRGMKTALEKYGFFQHKTNLFGYVNTTIKKIKLRELLD